MDMYTATQPAATDSRYRAAGSVPADFNPAACPILAEHFFGIEPSRPIGQIASEVIAELSAEIATERGIRTIIDQKLDRYAELDLAASNATGGNHPPMPPQHEFCDG